WVSDSSLPARTLEEKLKTTIKASKKAVIPIHML
ncbi:unnamed protein product, partial [marine sediment metagenome]